MGVKPRFSYNDLEKAINKELINIEKGLIRIMQRCGEEFVTEAREGLSISSSLFPKGDYKDQTANLRSSIGYYILRDNEVVINNLKGTSRGQAEANVALSMIAPKSGYRLIGIAGMDYASRLESKGYNVISSQQDVCLVNLGERLKKYASQLSKKNFNIDFTTNF